jgi:hypothetical protein
MDGVIFTKGKIGRGSITGRFGFQLAKLCPPLPPSISTPEFLKREVA